jgi:hypothetical protein
MCEYWQSAHGWSTGMANSIDVVCTGREHRLSCRGRRVRNACLRLPAVRRGRTSAAPNQDDLLGELLCEGFVQRGEHALVGGEIREIRVGHLSVAADVPEAHIDVGQ